MDIRARRNKWILYNAKGRPMAVLVQEDEPDPPPDVSCYWAPAWAPGRVRGDRVTPYDGGSPWAEAANRAMFRRATANE